MAYLGTFERRLIDFRKHSKWDEKFHTVLKTKVESYGEKKIGKELTIRNFSTADLVWDSSIFQAESSCAKIISLAANLKWKISQTPIIFTLLPPMAYF